MNSNTRFTKPLKLGLLGVVLATAAYGTKIYSSSDAVALTSNLSTVQVKRFDAPTVSKLWAEYEAVFQEQEAVISQIDLDVESAIGEIDRLVTKIDQDTAELLLADSNSGQIRLGLTAEY